MPQSRREALAWTWADLISTYRFWGLLLFYLFSLAGASLMRNLLGTVFLPASGGQSSIFSAISGVSAVLGIYPAWIAARYHAKGVLVAAALLQLAGVAAATVPELTKFTGILVASAVLCGLGAGTIALTVPVVLAAGRGGGLAFAIGFGAVTVFSALGDLCTAAMVSLVFATPDYAAVAVASLLALGLIILFPVRSRLFEEAPPRRGRAFTPARRNPVGVAFVCLIPFYFLYWIYRAHGEAAAIAIAAPRNLLSPRASLWIGLFAPFLLPFMMASLSDAAGGRRMGQSSLTVFLWSLLFPPVAAALVQSMMNQAAAGKFRAEAAWEAE